MPFTLSHPAAVLPLLPGGGRWAVAGVGSALAIGSMTPDLPYYVGMDALRPSTHTLASVVWFAVPAGLVAWLALQHLLKAPGLFLLPRAFAARIDPAPARLHPVAVPLALALGALTHVVWDTITHETGFALRGVPGLETLAGDAADVRLWTYGVLQYGSTLGGALVLALWTRAWLRRTPAGRRPASPGLPPGWRGPLRGALSVAPPAVGLAVAFAWAPPRAGALAVAGFLTHVAGASVSCAVALLLGLGLVARLRARAGA